MLTGKNEIEIRQLFVEIENNARKLGLHKNQGKTKYVIVECIKRINKKIKNTKLYI